MVEKIKKSMRISHAAIDEEIQRNVETCKRDLEMAGVYCKEDDSLYCKACEIYNKWQLNYMGKGEQFERAYSNLKDSMGLCGDYNVRPED